jgi:hypothetical protein
MVCGQRHAPAALPLEKRPGAHLKGAGQVLKPLCTCAENLARTGFQSLERPARTDSLYRLVIYIYSIYICICVTNKEAYLL